MVYANICFPSAEVGQFQVPNRPCGLWRVSADRQTDSRLEGEKGRLSLPFPNDFASDGVGGRVSLLQVADGLGYSFVLQSPVPVSFFKGGKPCQRSYLFSLSYSCR